MVDAGHGEEIARVVTLGAPLRVSKRLTNPMRVIRQATEEDLAKVQQNLEKQGLSKCQEMASQLSLSMKPLEAHYDAESGRLTIFFRAEERVDFRELVRKLSEALETRVELRQIGARDEAKLLGGIGRCGRLLCCQSHLTTFSSISIKMAKEQGLALNPMKISGLCGKLLCCLAYESKEYAEMKKKMPQPGQEITTPWGKAKVISTNILKETVTVQLVDSEAVREIALADIAHPRAQA